MKAAAEAQSGEGAGIGGLAGRFMRRQPQARSKTLTMTNEMQSIGTSVADTDIQIPAGFKEKK